MTLQISPVGLAIIAVFYLLSTVLLSRIWRGLREWRGRWKIVLPLTLVLLALPWVDEIYIAYGFAKLCKDAGVHVVTRVEVEGFLHDTSRSSSYGAKPTLITNPQAIEQFDTAGYRFREDMLTDGKVRHLERVKDGLQISILDRPTARYHYKFADPNQEVVVGYRLEKTEDVVVDSETGDVIGRDIQYSRYPGWVESLWVRFFGMGRTTCKGSAPMPPELRHVLYHYVLTPTGKTN